MQGFFRKACLAIGISMVVQAGPAFAKEDKFAIGGLLALSGPLGILGGDARKGMDLAIEERGGKLLGVPIDMQWEDTESKPQVAVQKATRVLSKGVKFVVGSVGSGETLAIMKVTAGRQVPLLVPLSTDPSITGENRNEFTFRTAPSGDSFTPLVIEYIKTAKPKKVYGVASDYGVSKAGWNQVKAALGKDVQVVGEDFPALGAQDFSVIVNKIANSGAELVYVGTGGSDSVAFLKQASEIKLKSKVTMIGPNLVDSTLAKAVGDGALGILSATRYDFSLDNAPNKAFVERYRKKYNEYPSQLAGEAYDGLKWWLDTVDATGSWDSAVWMKAFRTSKWQTSIVGQREMRACDNQSQNPGFIGEVVKGVAPQPDYTMKVIASFKAEAVATKCP
ncbi:MAG TPA: ABC transporter substrate-binding protein [Ramlibacter sp.]|nr:ABC transporter substrate-binding protein [Ramlibacter sp.]